MAEELDALIKRINTEAVTQAESASNEILEKARKRSADIIQEAEQRATKLLDQARKDSDIFTERGKTTLEQVARDLLMTVGEGVHNILNDLVSGAVNEVMDIGLLRELIGKCVDAYLANEGRENRISILLHESDKEKLLQFFKDRYQNMMSSNLEIVVDDEIFQGFRVSYGEGSVYHDFTNEAIAESFVHYLRPGLAEIVVRAAKQPSSKGETDAV